MKENHTPKLSEDDVSRLLRFKRYEMPPPGFHEDFLREFQRRQRLESMRPNWWQRFKEAVEEVLDRVRVPGYAYATVGLFAVASGAWIMSSDEIGVAGSQPVALAAAPAPSQELKLELTSTPQTVLPNPVNIPDQRLVGTLPPRYLLQSRPASEQEPFSF